MSSKSGKSLSRQEMKKVLGGSNPLPVCVPNGGIVYDSVLGCCSGHSCAKEFGSAPICYDPNGIKPCLEIPF